MNARERSRTAVWATAALVAASFAVALAYLPVHRASGQRASFYQESFGPAVMLACGRGLVNPEVAPGSALASFLATTSDAFACETLPAVVQERAFEPFQGASLSLLWAAGMVWRHLGVSWPALDLVAALLFSVAIGASFVALRYLGGSAVALLVATLWATSPMHLGNLANLRDYAKTPFFALMLALSALVAREQRPRRLILMGAIFGAVQAIGFGMRTDVILNFAPFLIVLFFARAERPWQQWRVKAAAAAVCLAVFVVGAAPVLSAYTQSSALWHVALLGLTTPFDAPLNLRPAPYDFGHLYNDSYVSATVHGFFQRVHPGARPPVFATPEYDALCAEYYRTVAATFPADILTRMVGAALRVLNLPFTISYGYAPAGVEGWVARASEIRSKWLLSLTGAGPMLLGAVLALSAAQRTRQAVVVGALVLVWAAYPFLQFQGRHVFHLELLTLALLGLFVSLIIRFAREAKPAPLTQLARGAGMVVAMCFAIAAALLVARLVQAPRAQALLDAYSRASRQAVPLEATAASSDGAVRLAAPSLFASVPEAPLGAAYLVLEIEGSSDAQPISVTTRYEEQRPQLLLDFSRTREVHVAAGEQAQLFFMAYALQRDGEVLSQFTAVEVPAHAASRVRLYRVDQLERFPLALDTLLVDGRGGRAAAQRVYLGLLLPERVWLKAVQWWPQLSSLG